MSSLSGEAHSVLSVWKNTFSVVHVKKLKITVTGAHQDGCRAGKVGAFRKRPNFVRAVTQNLLVTPLEHFKKKQHSKTLHRAFGVPLAAADCTEWNNLAYDISAQVYEIIKGIVLSLIPFSAYHCCPWGRITQSQDPVRALKMSSTLPGLDPVSDSGPLS